MRSPALRTYRALTRLAEPLAPNLLRGRAKRGKEDPARLGERLGRPSVARPQGRLLWLHGASVGESLALLAIVNRARVIRPDAAALVTAGTRTAQEVLAQRLPPEVIAQYAPIDTAAAVSRFMKHWRPDLGVLMESELWPNLILGAQARGTKLALASARLSEASARRWRRTPAAARALLRAFDLILARDAEQAARIEALGGAVQGRMDLKYGAPLLPGCGPLRSRLDALWRGRPVILGASTHPGEEALIARAFLEARADRGDAVLVLVPRHPDRGPSVAAEVEAMGLRVVLRSRGGPEDAPVLVADTLGELGAWYRLADLALIGGSLLPGVGGHNPMEPARLDCAFVAGPHHTAWPVFDAMAAAGATRIVEPAALPGTFALAWREPKTLKRMAAEARAFVAERDGLVREGIDRVLSLIPS